MRWEVEIPGWLHRNFCNKVLRYGLCCEYWADTHFQTIAASLLEEQDVMILFSVSGGTKDMLDIAKQASQQGVKLVIVTNHLKSPLAKYADALLYVVAKKCPAEQRLPDFKKFRSCMLLMCSAGKLGEKWGARRRIA